MPDVCFAEEVPRYVILCFKVEIGELWPVWPEIGGTEKAGVLKETGG